MRVLALTSSLDPTYGYGTLSYYLKKHAAGPGTGIGMDVFTAERRRGVGLGRKALRSELYEYRPALGPALAAADAANVLLTAGRRFDLVHAMVEHYAPAALFLSRLLGIPYVVTANGTYAVKLPLEYPLIRKAFARADRVLPISRYTERRMREEGLEFRSEVVTLGVEKAVFRPDLAAPRRDEITFVGNFKRRKGLQFLLDALALARPRIGAVKLRVIGKVDLASAEAAAAREFAAAHGFGIEFAGFMDEAGLVDAYRSARLNVLPSKSERFFFEGFGLIHLEANACGTLTIGTRGSGNEDAVTPGMGYLVDYGDVPALAARIAEAFAAVPYPVFDQDALPAWEDVGEAYRRVYLEVSAGRRPEPAVAARFQEEV